MKTIITITTVIVAAFVAGAVEPKTAPIQPLTIEQLIDIKHPSNPVWSPDGKHITFSWDRAGVTARYISDIDGRDPRPVTDTPPSGANMNGTPSPDGSRVAFVRSTSSNTGSGSVSVGSGFSRTEAPQPTGRGGRGGRGAAASGPSELWVRMVADGQETRVAGMENGIGGVSWSPDGAYLLFTSGGGAIRHEQTPPYSGAKIIYTTMENQPGQTYSVPVAGGPAISLPQGGFGGRRLFVNDPFATESSTEEINLRSAFGACAPPGIPIVMPVARIRSKW